MCSISYLHSFLAEGIHNVSIAPAQEFTEHYRFNVLDYVHIPYDLSSSVFTFYSASNQFRRITRDNTIRREIFCQDTAYADNRPFCYMPSNQYVDIVAYPYVIVNDNWLWLFVSLLAHGNVCPFKFMVLL